ncbi:MAG: hypothetical protein MJZ94_05175, partial [Bacteroidales bacterium]|nr:hypothetical protein [Bacteroidales bacterium]
GLAPRLLAGSMACASIAGVERSGMGQEWAFYRSKVMAQRPSVRSCASIAGWFYGLRLDCWC